MIVRSHSQYCHRKVCCSFKLVSLKMWFKPWMSRTHANHKWCMLSRNVPWLMYVIFPQLFQCFTWIVVLISNLWLSGLSITSSSEYASFDKYAIWKEQWSSGKYSHVICMQRMKVKICTVSKMSIAGTPYFGCIPLEKGLMSSNEQQSWIHFLPSTL